MRRISIAWVKEHKTAYFAAGILTGIALCGSFYYISIYETPEECILHQLTNRVETRNNPELLERFKDADARAVASRFLADAKYRQEKYDERDWETYTGIESILIYCDVEI